MKTLNFRALDSHKRTKNDFPAVLKSEFFEKIFMNIEDFLRLKHIFLQGECI